MASPPSPTAALPSEASCPICRDYFRDPVSIHCGHNFCRACITRCWEWSTSTFSCPRCRETAAQKDFRPSRELARVLEVAKRLSLKVAKKETRVEEEEEEEKKEEEEGCEKHQEPLKVFCKDDGVFLCPVCRESRAHRSHVMVPLGDLLQEYKGQIQTRLQTLKEERDQLLAFREAEMRKSWEYLEKTEAERRKVLSRLEGLRLFLEDHARGLLLQLRDLEKEVEKTQEDNLTNLTQEISRLDAFIQEMEEKCQEPAKKFLEDIRGTLSRLEKERFQQPQLLVPELEEKIAHFREKNTALEETLRTFQEALMFELPQKTKVTLDPSTAHPQLVVSEDGRSVRWEEEEEGEDQDGEGEDQDEEEEDQDEEEEDQDDEEDPQQDPRGPGADPCVLGFQAITSGRFCWEVEVSPKGSWALGVAKESLKKREETSTTGPEVELWSMGLCEGQFWALTSLERVPLYHLQVPRRLRVALDYEKGEVAFFDAEKKALMFSFSAASFRGEKVHPWFLVWGQGSQLTLLAP